MRRKWGRWAELLCASSVLAFALCCLFSGSALAVRGHVFSSAFGGPGIGPGQFSEPAGVAVNEATGAVYIVDKGNGRVEWFDSSGATLEGQWDASGAVEVKGVTESSEAAPSGKLLNPDGIAVDNTCFRHEQQTGQALSGAECEALDPSDGDVYVVDGGHKVIDKFSAAGEYIGQITETPSGVFGELNGVAIDIRGSVYVYEEQTTEHAGVDEFTNGTDNVFVRFIVPRALRGVSLEAPGIAVDAADNLYLHTTNLRDKDIIVKFDKDGAVLNEQLSAEPPSGVAVESTRGDAYVDNVTSVSRFSSAGALEERLSVSMMQGSGVTVNAASGLVYVADSASDDVNIFALEGVGRPTVESIDFGSVAATDATVEAEVNPRGAATSYRFEYGECADPAACAGSPFDSESPIPDGAVGRDFEVHSVRATLDGLNVHSTYHFRVTAVNSQGGTTSPEKVFLTQTAEGLFGLPDGRDWELVSPSDKFGGLIRPITGDGVVQAAADGGAISYLSNAPTEGAPQGNANLVQVLSARRPDGWSSKDIAPPHNAATGATVGQGEEYATFSEDLSLGILQPLGSFTPQLSEEASEQTPYLHTSYAANVFPDICTSGCFRPLVTGKPGFANVPPGTPFGDGDTCSAEPESGSPAELCGPRFLGGTKDLSKVVIRSNVPLTDGAPTEGGFGLYEWAGGALALVSVLPDGTPAEAGENLALGAQTEGQGARGAISEDGNRIVWEANSALYVRDVALEQTVQVDAAEPACLAEGECSSGGAKFQVASDDGSRVFFTDAQRLTSDAGPAAGGPDLYECVLIVQAETVRCLLSDLTPAGTGENADVQGALPGASASGDWLYFVANGALAPGAVAGSCGGRVSTGQCNLYALHFTGAGWEAPKLVTTLSGEDRPDWALGELENLSTLTARSSSNGAWLTFMSSKSLTGYDNRDLASGQRDEEVYLYHAGAGTTPVCVSCNPTGARPAGAEYGPLRTGEGGLVGGAETWGTKRWLAANVPGWTGTSPIYYQSRYLSDSGRLFFNARDSLVPADVNGAWDVYEYEPDGVGGTESKCSQTTGSKSAVFAPGSAGCVGLISSGGSAEESAFLDASQTGSDVFFLTHARLTSKDEDSSLDVYDAHECTSSSPCLSSRVSGEPACSTSDTCQGPSRVLPDLFGPPASAALGGTGNLAPLPPGPVIHVMTRAEHLAKALKMCKKQRPKLRRACERRAKKRYGRPARSGKHRKRRKPQASARTHRNGR